MVVSKKPFFPGEPRIPTGYKRLNVGQKVRDRDYCLEVHHNSIALIFEWQMWEKVDWVHEVQKDEVFIRAR